MRDEKGQHIFKGFLEKLRAVFYPPGYFPGVEVVPYFHWFSLKDHTDNIPEASFDFFKLTFLVSLRNLTLFVINKTKQFHF